MSLFQGYGTQFSIYFSYSATQHNIAAVVAIAATDSALCGLLIPTPLTLRQQGAALICYPISVNGSSPNVAIVGRPISLASNAVALDAKAELVCWLDTMSKLHCWGDARRMSSVAKSGMLQRAFASISVGINITCGILKCGCAYLLRA